jgi:hypothetical protein
MTLWKWSQTAADNDDADATINLRENQAPSTYNNAVRGAMAAAAKYRDDMSGNLVTAGTSTAVTLTTNQTLTSLTDGFSVVARITTTTGVDPTLVVDSLTAKQIRYKAATNIPTGALLAGTIQKFTYDSGDDSWIVSGWFGTMMTTTDNPDLVAIEALAGTSGALKKTAANTWALDDLTSTIIFIKDSGNSAVVLDTGIMGDLQIDFACTITGVSMLGDQSGSAVVDIWKDTYANYPPTDADSITASAPPTISGTTKSTDTTLTGWTTSISAGDTLRFNLDSVTSFTRLTIKLKVKRYT